MIKRLIFFLQLVLFAMLSACATMPSPAGKWTTSIESPQGPMKAGFDFQVDGKALTGSTSNDFVGSIPISDGTVNGKDVSFKVRIEGGPGGAMTLNYKGVLEKDQIKFNMTFEGGAPPGAPANVEFTADRVPES